MNLMIVEDDPALARGLQVNLELEGYQVFWADSLKKAFEINDSQSLDLVVLDLGLADGTGFDFLKHVREVGSRLPVLILSAQTDEDSVVKGLQMGANDFVRKPFGNRELLARIKTILREPLLRENQLRFGEMILLLDQRVVKFRGNDISINRREFDILTHFMQRPGVIVSRENLIAAIDKDAEIYDRTIDSHVSHLRKKLKDNGVDTIKILSVYGMGYRIEKYDKK
ncbi:MAG: DNA-binding response regulator [Bdellovibrionaceae bacterium]|nr:DNA-binding response regulator [Pseudobdellovibrionaceae bacterium]